MRIAWNFAENSLSENKRTFSDKVKTIGRLLVSAHIFDKNELHIEKIIREYWVKIVIFQLFSYSFSMI